MLTMQHTYSCTETETETQTLNQKWSSALCTRLLLLIIPSRPLEHRRDLVSILFAQPRQHNLQPALARVA
jgi:hypothetical protein